MSCEEREMRSRRRLPCSPAAAAPLDDDDLLSEILLRLPPLPSSLPRASTVCKRWRSLASDPAFSRRFRRHHRRNPPLLGCFLGGLNRRLSFEPTLEAPDSIQPHRFSMQFDNDTLTLGCRHGLVLFWDRKLLQLLVWDPVTGQQHRLAVPPGFDPTKATVHGAVLRFVAGDDQQFKVILVVGDYKDIRWLACVYSSETGMWGNIISTQGFFGFFTKPAVLVDGSFYWVVIGSSLNILEFDLERESLSVIPLSGDVVHNFTVMRAEGGGLGLLSMSGFTAKLWKRNTDSDGVGSWGTGTTINLDKLLSLNSDEYPMIHGFAEDTNLVLLWTGVGLFTVHLESLQFKRLPKPEMGYHYHTFESVYAAGI